MQDLTETASQTAGPYVHIGCTPNVAGIAMYGGDLGAVMRTGPVQGEPITITGAVHDGQGAVLKDALVEIWQADAAGLFNTPHERRGQPDPNFTGFGRSAGDMRTGAFTFHTVRPGRVPWPNGRLQAPHVSVWIVARGINIGLQTRLYFEDEAAANAEDPILSRIEHRDRLQTLIARRTAPAQYRFDIHLQGPQETVFLDI